MNPTASQLYRIRRCPTSAALPQVHESSEHAERGIVLHAYLAAVRKDPAAALAAVPEDYRDICEAIEITALPVTLDSEVPFSIDMVTGKARVLPRGHHRDYSSASSDEWCGTADVVGVDGSTVFVADYFSGFRSANKGDQLRFLALAAARVYDCEDAAIETIYLRADGSTHRHRETLDIFQLEQAYADLQELRAQVDMAHAAVASGNVPSVAVGEWCTYCPAKLSCPAHAGLLIRAARGEDITSPYVPGPLTRDMVGRAHELSGLLHTLARELDKRVAAAVKEFRECPTPSGGVLRFALTDGNEKIDGDAAYEYLRARFGADLADQCVERKATKKRLGEAMRAAFGRDGKAREEDVLSTLRATGAITKTSSEKLVEISAERRNGAA